MYITVQSSICIRRLPDDVLHMRSFWMHDYFGRSCFFVHHARVSVIARLNNPIIRSFVFIKFRLILQHLRADRAPSRRWAVWAPAQHAPLYGTRTIVYPIQGETPLLYVILRSRLCHELRVPTLEQNQQVQTCHYTIIVNFRREKLMQQ